MLKMEKEKPAVLIPYGGPDTAPGVQDTFVYLRPETNGVAVESLLFQVIKENPLYQTRIKLVYLANIPGAFIVSNKLVEHHYAIRLLFARCGADCFTPAMRKRFVQYFGVPIEEVRVFSAFQAMKELGYTADELFNLWVDEKDMYIVNGEVIKRKDNYFIVNADLPAILHKNNNLTDIAVMIFRSDLQPAQMHEMIQLMGDRLKEKGILDPGLPVSRAFHHSKGPFESVLDAMGYLYDPSCSHVPIRDISFCRYTLDHGYSTVDLADILRHPIISYRSSTGELVEDDIYSYTRSTDYPEALRRYREIVCFSTLENKDLGPDSDAAGPGFWQDIFSPGRG